MAESAVESLIQRTMLAQQQAESGDGIAARAHYDEIAPQAGADTQLNLKLAELALKLHLSEASLGHLQTVMATEPYDADTLVTAARCLGELNRHEEAIALARRAVSKDPEHVDAQSLLGSLLTEAGETQDAEQHFQSMIDAGTNLRLASTNLARLRKFTDADGAVIKKIETALNSDIPPREQLAIHFALGKIYDDCGEYEKAFGHFRQANLLQKEPYDHDNDVRWFEQIKSVFTASNIEKLSENGLQSRQPVFIVGMPRSGTTLMERIVASHSLGAGAGELVAISQIAHQVMRENESKPAERALKRMTSDHLREYADHYLQVLRMGMPECSRIVDKLPGNYQNIGLIHALFPNASIIHAIRHPLDTCLSCYFQAFAEVRWSNALKSIADTYKLYRQYMDYWNKVLPAGTILDVNYESLVENPEAEGKRMLSHCGLEWEPQSLEYHQQQAVVRTASHAQVRQPIYQTSRMRWVNYAGHLQDLVNELADYLGEQRSVLANHGLIVRKKKRFGLF